MKQEMVGFWDGGGISWTTCKQSAPCSREITTPTPHHSIFTGRMLFLMPNRQCQSTEGTSTEGAESGIKKHKNAIMNMLRSISKVLFFNVLKTFLNILQFFLQWFTSIVPTVTLETMFIPIASPVNAVNRRCNDRATCFI